jgi:hypothetical protein
MNILLTILAAIFGISGFVCAIIILIEAFKDEVWKGFVCLLCGFYMLWYAFTDFEHDNKWGVVLVWLFGSLIASGLLNLIR